MVLVRNIVPDEVRLIEACHVNHRCLKDIEQPIEVVCTPIVELATGDCFHTPPPIWIRSPIAATPHLNAKDFTDNTGMDEFTKCPKIGIPPSVVMNGQHNVILFGGRNHFSGFCDGDTHRFFNNDMFTCFETRYSGTTVQAVREDVRNQVDTIVRIEFFNRVIGADARKILFRGFCSLRINVTDGNTFDAVCILHHIGMGSAHIECRAIPEDGTFDDICHLFHSFSLCGCLIIA